jgi:tRNA(fMet)-specific endonuclease VapC
VDDTLILESSVLIDLEREAARGSQGPAMGFLALHPHHRFVITPIIAGELASGASMTSRDRWERFLRPFRSLALTSDVAWRYGQAYRYLRANGLTIGANDLWIAATALAYEIPVVTANVRDFRRVPGLEVVDYR